MPAGAEGLVEGEVRLVSADEVHRGPDDDAVELGNIGDGHARRVGVEADAEEASVAFGGGEEFFGEGGHGRLLVGCGVGAT